MERSISVGKRAPHKNFMPQNSDFLVTRCETRTTLAKQVKEPPPHTHTSVLLNVQFPKLFDTSWLQQCTSN